MYVFALSSSDSMQVEPGYNLPMAQPPQPPQPPQLVVNLEDSPMGDEFALPSSTSQGVEETPTSFKALPWDYQIAASTFFFLHYSQASDFEYAGLPPISDQQLNEQKQALSSSKLDTNMRSALKYTTVDLFGRDTSYGIDHPSVVKRTMNTPLNLGISGLPKQQLENLPLLSVSVLNHVMNSQLWRISEMRNSGQLGDLTTQRDALLLTLTSDEIPDMQNPIWSIPSTSSFQQHQLYHFLPSWSFIAYEFGILDNHMAAGIDDESEEAQKKRLGRFMNGLAQGIQNLEDTRSKSFDKEIDVLVESINANARVERTQYNLIDNDEPGDDFESRMGKNQWFPMQPMMTGAHFRFL